MISPYDSDLIHDGSEVRRKFFDMIISQFDKNYLQHLINYQKLIIQRNGILKQFIEQRIFDASLLQIYDEQLITHGNYIHKKRKEYLENIIYYFQNYYDFLSDKQEDIGIIYESGLSELSFEEGLKQYEVVDRKSGYTNFGIHKDDFLFTINGRSVKRFASQGQQKSFSIALKLSQFDYIYTQKKIKPILLLDDIFDKLDMNRVGRLLELVGKEEIGQVFISDTNMKRISEILDYHQIEHRIYSLIRW